MTRTRLRPVDVAREFGRSVAWLKGLEKAGVIPPAPRDELNGDRIYSPEDVQRIREAVLNRKRMAGAPA